MKGSYFFALLLLLVSSCSLASSEVIASDFELPPMVEVTFKTLIPENSDLSDGVVFTLLDPLTGENINPKHYLMEIEGDRSFSVTLSVVAGSMLHYRYERGESALIREIGNADAAIMVRRYFVDGPGHVATDIVVGWEDQVNDFATGSISGSIMDADNGDRLENVLVSASGRETRSNQNGEFTVSGLVQGLHTIVAESKNGDYQVFQQGALVASGLETPANIKMQANERILVQFVVRVPQEHVPGVPLFLLTDLNELGVIHSNGQDSEGQYTFSAELPAGVDIRYKYSLGDGFWNAELTLNGHYLVRQLVLRSEMDGVVILDQIADWEAGNSAAIWFEMQADDTNLSSAFIQFKFIDWTPAIRMWPLGEGLFAYKLNSPTNFAAPIEYRYCQDSFCLSAEDAEGQRNAIGNLESVQYIEDQVRAWK